VVGAGKACVGPVILSSGDASCAGEVVVVKGKLSHCDHRGWRRRTAAGEHTMPILEKKTDSRKGWRATTAVETESEIDGRGVDLAVEVDWELGSGIALSVQGARRLCATAECASTWTVPGEDPGDRCSKGSGCSGRCVLRSCGLRCVASLGDGETGRCCPHRQGFVGPGDVLVLDYASSIAEGWRLSGQWQRAHWRLAGGECGLETEQITRGWSM